VGALDTTLDGGLDMSCPALAQGNSRVARAQAFVRLVTEKYKVPQRLMLVRGCGHEERCVFTSDLALPLLVPIEHKQARPATNADHATVSGEPAWRRFAINVVPTNPVRRCYHPGSSPIGTFRKDLRP
jgi:hypothetical protein